MKCPICKREVKFDDPFMPFCSARCKDADLDNWASEKYSFEGQAKEDDLEDPVTKAPEEDEEGDV